MDTERIGDFFRSNYLYLIGSFLYFLLAVAMLGGIWQAFWICLLLYAASMGLAVSPLGESLMRILNHIRPVETRQEREYLFPLFEDVYQTAKENFSGLGYIDLYIQDTMAVNACAVDSHTIAVTKGAIETFSEDELKGILFHEIAHIYYGHTTMSILAIIGNGFFSIFVLIARILMVFLDALSRSSESGIGHFIVSLCRLILDMTVFVFTLLFNIIFAINSRDGEYLADKFAHANGYGQELVDALYILQRMSLGDNANLIARMTASHPRISKRIMNLENYLGMERERQP